MEKINSFGGLHENFTPSSQKMRGISFTLTFSCGKNNLEPLEGFISKKNLPVIHVTIVEKIYPLTVLH